MNTTGGSRWFASPWDPPSKRKPPTRRPTRTEPGVTDRSRTRWHIRVGQVVYLRGDCQSPHLALMDGRSLHGPAPGRLPIGRRLPTGPTSTGRFILAQGG